MICTLSELVKLFDETHSDDELSEWSKWRAVMHALRRKLQLGEQLVILSSTDNIHHVVMEMADKVSLLDDFDGHVIRVIKNRGWADDIESAAELPINRALQLYVQLTATPNLLQTKEYTKIFDRLRYDEQGELSHMIAVHFGERI